MNNPWYLVESVNEILTAERELIIKVENVSTKFACHFKDTDLFFMCCDMISESDVSVCVGLIFENLSSLCFLKNSLK